MLNRLLNRAARHYRLQKKYQVLNSVVVFGGVAGTVPLWISWIRWSRLVLGLPLESAPMDGLVFQFLVWVLLALVGLVAVFYVGVMIAAAVLMLLLIVTRSVSTSEAVDFVLHSKYPERWFESDG